jgi:ribonuclease BN (tRNA processing enzyme)
MFDLIMLGVGSAFTIPGSDFNLCDWQSNILIRKNDKNLLLDCGSDIRFSYTEAGYRLTEINGIYVSHLHADHVGGIEGVAFSNFFSYPQKRPTLFSAASLVGPLWNQSLKGGLESIEGRRMDLTGYFDVHRIPKNGFFIWEGIRFDLVQVVHVMAERSIKHSYGLMISENSNSPKIFWTSDTQFCPNQIRSFYTSADLILQDCETSPFHSGVHAHYEELKTLDPAVKAKMHLYHYQPGTIAKLDAPGDGFAGFLRKRDGFRVSDTIEQLKADL